MRNEAKIVSRVLSEELCILSVVFTPVAKNSVLDELKDLQSSRKRFTEERFEEENCEIGENESAWLVFLSVSLRLLSLQVDSIPMICVPLMH